MKQKSPKASLLKSITVIGLKNYLKDMGWTEEESHKELMMKFKSPRPIRSDGKYVNLFIPKTENLVDYNETIDYILRSLSAFERRDRMEIINRILIFADHLQSRIIEAKKGMIPLDRGVILYEGLRDLIISGAASLLDPSAKRPSRGEKAKKYGSSSLIGPSEYGSYIANIYIPLDRPNPNFSFTASPSQRAVVLRILRGLETLRESVHDGNPDPIIKNYTTGLNSNMCSALINIIDAGMGNNVIINAILEPTYEPPKDIRTKFTLTPKSTYYLEKAIDALNEEKPSKTDGQWFGFPRLFDRPEAAQRGDVKLETVDPEKGHINIFINFNDSDYQICARANLEKKNIQISGILEKVGNKWILNDPTGLEVVGGKLRKIGPEQISFKNFEKR